MYQVGRRTLAALVQSRTEFRCALGEVGQLLWAKWKLLDDTVMIPRRRLVVHICAAQSGVYTHTSPSPAVALVITMNVSFVTRVCWV